ncbi:MAG: ABC transporter permease [Actinobacteria bacterium]|nr:ABC transporter permease [Actinomycetota bacterium]
MSFFREKIKEYIDYRELLFSLVIKELKVKYKNSALGFFWSFVNPLLLMAVYTFIFSVVFKSKGIQNFPIYLLIGLLPWNFLALSVGASVMGIVGNANLVKKVYFPREFLPASVVFANLVNFMLELLVLFVFLLIFGYKFYFYIPILLLAIVLEILVVIGFCLFFASTNVYYRDVQQLVNVILLLWFFVTPIVYQIEMVPAKLQPILKLNPMASIILLYRAALYKNELPSLLIVGAATISALVAFAIGYATFMRLSASFAKEI